MLFLVACLLLDEASMLSARVEASPKLPLQRTEVRVQVPGLGFPSAVTMDAAGLIYVLQREEKLDPLMVVDAGGKVLRSWDVACMRSRTASGSTRKETCGP
jgi:hypothetical protein